MAAGSLALGLAHDPRVHPARVLDRHGRTIRAIVDDDPRRVAVIAHPVRLELEGDVRDDRGREDPVEVICVEPVDDVGDPDRPATLDAGKKRDDSQPAERVADLRERGRLNVRFGQAGRGRSQRREAGRRSSDVGQGDLRLDRSDLEAEAYHRASRTPTPRVPGTRGAWA
jgi:hypothetical protein